MLFFDLDICFWLKLVVGRREISSLRRVAGRDCVDGVKEMSSLRWWVGHDWLEGRWVHWRWWLAMTVGGFERDEMEERWVHQRWWLALNGNGEGFGHLLLLSPLKIGGGPMGRWGLLGLLWRWVGFKRDEVEERWVC